MVFQGSRHDRRPRPFQRWVYPCALDAVYAATLLAITPWLLATRRAGHSYGHVARRRGNVEIRATGRPRLWIHGVSVGEVLSVRALVRDIQENFPEWELVFSATSQAGLSVVRRLYPGHAAFEYPLDFSWAVRRAMDRVRPDLILIVEHELWPNFLHQAHLNRVPAVVVNALISDRSIRGYRLLSRFMRWPPPAIVHYCAQNLETLNRLSGLGVKPEKVTVTGNLKYDNPCHDARDLRTELGIPPHSWVMVGASTHDGEEAILFQAFQRLRSRDPAARLVLIPRNVERVGQIGRLIQHGGFEPHLRSMTNGGMPAGQDPKGVIVVDTMGELPAFCRMGNVVFVGGTMVPFGGHNVIEPASLGRPVVVGPHTENFRSVIEDFLHAGAISVADGPEGLSRIIERFHDDHRSAEEMGDRARQVVMRSGGASRRTFEVLARIMGGIGAARPAALPQDSRQSTVDSRQ